MTAGLGPNSVTFNPWVEISPEKITLIAQHADIGQGVGSVQPIMIAEELDLDPGQFEIRFAGPSPAYFNTGFADELAPFLAADQSPAAEEARAAALECLRKSGLQMTGGSSTIPDTYEKLRIAGAVARETLKAAAAKRAGVAVADIRTQSGHVILPDGTQNSLCRARGGSREDSAGAGRQAARSIHNGELWASRWRGLMFDRKSWAN